MLHLNGWAVPVTTCEPAQVGISEARGYSPNGVYQFARNGFARAWRVRTGLLTSAERDALLEMLGHRGDGWQHGLRGTAPAGIHTDSKFFYTDKTRPAQSAEEVATVESAYAADGARVYDWNDNTLALHDGAEGMLHVSPATTNLLSANEAHPTANGHLTDVATGTHAADTARYWTGSGAVEVTVAATGDGVEADATATIGQIYQLSAYVSPRAGGEAIRVEYLNAAAAVIATANYTLPSDVDTWMRVKVSGTQVTDTTAKIRVTMPSATGAFGIDGLQIEQVDTAPTAWVDPGADVWGSGNGVRPAGVLDYDLWTSNFTHGITIAAWANLQFVGAGVARTIVRTSSGGSRAVLDFTTDDKAQFLVIASDGSTLVAQSSALTVGHYHLVGMYNPTGTPTATLYSNGSSVATDTTWSGDRTRWDVDGHSGDFCIGSTGSAGTSVAHTPIGAIQVLPYVVPASVVSGWYASAATARPPPGVMPIQAHGSFLQSGNDPNGVEVFAQVDAAPHEPWFSSGTWQERGGRVAFTLFEASTR